MNNPHIFNIHGTLVSLDSVSKSLKKAMSHQLEYFKVANDDDLEFDVIIRDYSAKPNIDECRVASDYYYYHDGLIDIPDHNLCFDLAGACHYYYLDNFVLPVNLIIQLAIQRKGKTLVHSAAISYGEESVLFPALGGIGKTTIVSHAMKEGGRLYGDDMCIIDADANLYPYPIDFSVYHYHYKLLGINRSLKRKIFSVAAGVLWIFDLVPVVSWFTRRIRGKFFPECENISPLLIYGEDRIAPVSKMSRLIYIGRHKNLGEQTKIGEVTNKIVADKITSILLSEWKDALGFLQVYSAFSDNFSYLEMCKDIHEISFQAASRTVLADISIDSNVQNKKYIKLLWQFLWN